MTVDSRVRPPRLATLDLLRGAAVAGMILVTSGGSWAHSYAPLKHAEWTGWTAADMVFPSFLFAVGMTLGLSCPRPRTATEAVAFWRRLVRRAVALIVLGLVLNALSALAFFDLAHTRLPGILQRIALCLLLGAVAVRATARTGRDGLARANRTALWLVIAAILVGYWALLSLVPVPGFDTGRLDPEGNLPAFVDRLVFTVPHLWPYGTDAAGKVVYDPEGLLSTLPATVNLLVGLLAADEWRERGEGAIVRIAGAGALLLAAGLLLNPVFPINKRIWTSSFALVSSGASALILAALALVARSPAGLWLLAPLRVLGGNAILAFTISTLLGIFGGLPLFHDASGTPLTPAGSGFAVAGRVVSDPNLASLLCAIAILALITLAIAPLHRHAIHLRI